MDLRRPLSTLSPPAVVAALAVVVGVSACAVDGAAPPIPAPATAASSAPPAAVAERVGAVVPEPPRAVRLPDGRRVRIRTVGTVRNGVLDVPPDIHVAGWWRGGSRLGDPFGSTLVAAHVDSRAQGLGPFASLLGVRAGDRLQVSSRTLRQTFEVTSLRLRPQGTLGPRSWLHSPDGPRRLTLVTCAGPYDASHGGYQNLAVITAAPLGPAVDRP